MNRARIELSFLDWWHAGTGASGSGDADRICHRDEWGCPAIPMTQVMGILRETAEMRAGWDQRQVIDYFGGRTVAGEHGDAAPGSVLYSGDMTLQRGEQGYFNSDPEARTELFGLLHATAIDERTGTAKDKSLRLNEAAVPMTLHAEIEWSPAKEVPEDWISQMDMLCALTPSFGALTRDGYGRAIALCQEIA